MPKDVPHRPWRVLLDVWIARIGSVFAWVWLVFWGLIGLVGLGELIAGKAEDTVDVVMPFVSLGIAALNALLVRACRKTKELEQDFHLYCAVFAKEPDKSIEEVAKAIKEPVDTVMRQLKEMCRRGYFNGYIDYPEQRLVFFAYKPNQPETKNLTVIQCPGCGAVNAIAQTGDECKYCGAPLTLQKEKPV